MKRRNKNSPLSFQAGCRKRRLNLALGFCVYFVFLEFVFLVFLGYCYFMFSVVNASAKMTYYVSRGTLSNNSLTHGGPQA